MHLHHTLNTDQSSVLILQIGIGLIGTCISDAIKTSTRRRIVGFETYKMHWTKSAQLVEQLKSAFASITKFSTDKTELHIIWSAGEAGFSANQQSCDLELSVFMTMIRSISAMSDSIGIPRYFYLFSSAGGLYEGQYVRSPSEIPKPNRPYGYLKLQQEALVRQELKMFEKVFMLRPGSVYSHRLFSKRLGLIGVFLLNGIMNKVTWINGRENTLRDYILAEDISKFLLKLIFEKFETDEIIFLVSGRPMSIFSIRKQVEETLNKPLFLQYVQSENAENISYHSSLRHSVLEISPFPYTLRMAYEKIIVSMKR